ncbi:MAG: hypothetical protein ACFB10_17140 [Salibacteraceae bacterium]
MTAVFAWSQETSRSVPISNGVLDSVSLDPAVDRPTLMLIPFAPRMYRSDVDRDVAEASQLNFQQIRGFFRLGLDNALYIEADKTMQTVRMHADDPDINRDLYYIYKSINYDFVPVPAPEPDPSETKGVKGLVHRIKPKEPAPQEGGTTLENGQIQTTPDEVERYMKTKVVNPNMFDFLGEKYQADYYLFINELDLLNAANDYRDFESDNFSRYIKVHYTIFDADGAVVASNTTGVYFSSIENDLREIITAHFPKLAALVIQEVPQPILAVDPEAP